MKWTKSRLKLLLLAVAGLALATSVLVGTGSASPNPILLRTSGHPRLDSGKPVSHVSGGTEVTFDEERALGADTQGSSDLPPDGTVSALGCADRGSATNPRANQDCTSRRQAEEQVAVNPLDPTNVVVGQNDSRVGFNHCGFDYSLDGGSSWGDGQPGFFQHLSPLGHTYDAASDPALTFDGTGRAWYSCVLFDVNTNASGLAVVPSTPGLKGSAYANVSTGASPYVVAEDASGANFYDKEFIAGDQRPGSTNVYVTFTDFQSSPSCKRSNNRSGFCASPIYISKWTGSAWTTPLQISGQGSMCSTGNSFDKSAAANACNFDQGSYPVVLPNGDVYVAFSNFNTPTLVNQQLGVLVHVAGNTLTASAPVMVGVDDETKAALCDFGRGPEQCVDSLNVRSDDFPALALDPTNPSHLVAVWTDTRAATVNGNYDVVVSESFDGGATWSDRAGGGTVLTTGGAFFEPSVAITQTGTTAVGMYHANTAQHTSAVGDGTFGYGMEANSGGGFGSYVPVSDGQAYPSPQANAAQAGFLGDYSSAAASTAAGSNVVHFTWSDTRNSGTGGPDEDVFVATLAP
jgi:hypothetical protein